MWRRSFFGWRRTCVRTTRVSSYRVIEWRAVSFTRVSELRWCSD